MTLIAVELLSVACVAVFAFALWPPACLLVVGAAGLLASWRASQ
jgi:hypothetical protein